MNTNQEKHTPGPWTAFPPESDTDFPSEYWAVSDCYGRTATVYGDDEEAEANARLIAAAPDLLAACKKKLTSQMLRDTALTHELYTARDSAMQAAEEAEFEADEFMRAAIAKAEGI